MNLDLFAANAALTLAAMGSAAWYLRLAALQRDAEIKRKWETRFVTMESTAKAALDFVDERMAILERQLALLEGRLDLIERWQRAAKRQLERNRS